MQLSKGQIHVMDSDGHLLITGGPGSGKTTISILKAAQTTKGLRADQKILFLSFARATVSRVIEAIEYEQKIPPTQKKLIEVDTYHSFFWRIIKTHGYLIGLPRRLTILTPPAEAIALSGIRSGFPVRKLTAEQRAARRTAEETERVRLAKADGRVCFDLYAPYAGDILSGSKRIRRLFSRKYPIIVLDEFQDTNAPQWRVVQALAEFSTLIALADPEQRIYDWIGADPERLNQFRNAFRPTEVDLSTDNHRSSGTEIALFGNDVLTGNFRQTSYKGVAFEAFDPFPNPAMTRLVTTTYAARQRLIKQNVANWSIAILVPTKKMTRLVSDALRQPPAEMAEIPHVATIEMDAAILSAEVIASLLHPPDTDGHFTQLIDLLCAYYRGKGGDEPTQGALKEAAGLRKAHDEYVACLATAKALRKNSVLTNLLTVYQDIASLAFTGDPDADWRVVRRMLEEGACPRLREIAHEARNIRVLERGAQLRQNLAQDWLDHGSYKNALETVRLAFVQEHFSNKAKPESGVVVMNMHKAKGKQFDEVIIFEGWPIKVKGQPPYNRDRIVRNNAKEQIDDQARQNLRVSITRGKRRTTILTPRTDPCVIFTEGTWHTKEDAN